MWKQNSITGRTWLYGGSHSPKDNHQEDFLEKVLRNRGLTRDFLKALKPLPDQKKLKNLEKGADIALKAIQKKRHCVLMGDYDVDGLTSTALLYRYLTHLQVQCQWYIPDRINDGYGTAPVDQFPKDSLFFAMDWGTATPMDVEVIVLDHHKAQKPPSTSCVINPHLQSEEGFSKLPAVGITFFFLAELSEKLKKENIKPLKLADLVDLVMAGVICDVMPMNDRLNRLLVKKGLELLNQGKGNLGMRALLKKSYPPHDEQTIAFNIGPKINASSRIETADTALNLLITDSGQEADKLANKLADLNQKRKDAQQKMQREAMHLAANQGENNFVLVANPEWNVGLIGAVAGQMLSSLSRPVLVVGENPQKLYQGSARSTEYVDIGALVQEAVKKKILTAGGGHKKAAGFTLEEKNLPNFREFLAQSIREKQEKPCIADKITTISSVNQGHILEALQKLAPFGEGYRPPLLVLKRVKAVQVKKIRSQHLQFLGVSDLGESAWIWSFFSAGGPLEKAIMSGDPFNLLVQVTSETWQGKLRIKLKLLDIATP